MFRDPIYTRHGYMSNVPVIPPYLLDLRFRLALGLRLELVLRLVLGLGSGLG